MSCSFGHNKNLVLHHVDQFFYWEKIHAPATSNIAGYCISYSVVPSLFASSLQYHLLYHILLLLKIFLTTPFQQYFLDQYLTSRKCNTFYCQPVRWELKYKRVIKLQSEGLDINTIITNIKINSLVEHHRFVMKAIGSNPVKHWLIVCQRLTGVLQSLRT